MDTPRKKLVVVGLGMVGAAFIEKLLKFDANDNSYEITVLGEEPYYAYNRVGLTGFFAHRKIPELYLNPEEWYRQDKNKALTCFISTKVVDIDTGSKAVHCENGQVLEYDILVLATGSSAVVPRGIPGHDANGVFVYRTIDDLIRLIDFAGAHKGTSGTVLGGGLLGLEAAKAMMDLEQFSSVKLVEKGEWVLGRQLDRDAGNMVGEQVSQLGVELMLDTSVASIKVDDANNVTGVVFADGREVESSTVCFAMGIRPRDELARNADIACHERGGILVGDDLQTNKEGIYAIGECANWKDQVFGLIGPGVEMADVLAFNLTQAKMHSPRLFKTPDLSTKLKLLGVEVASFGDCFADRDGPAHLPPRYKKLPNGPNTQVLTYRDPFQHIYKKYIFTADGKYLLGGMLIGDTTDYVKVLPLVKSMKLLETPPGELILGSSKGDDSVADLPDDTQICSCHNVTKGDIVEQVKSGNCKDIAGIKKCTKAGTGCGGCLPLVTTIFNKAMTDMGNTVTNYLCEHFNYSRTELFHIISVKKHKTFAAVMADAGNNNNNPEAGSSGCELCKPAVASIFASLWNRHVLEPSNHGLQDTNDRYLGNIQRNGTYSVVPRVPGGEITPEKLLAIGTVAKRYGLYTKITGGQRIDLFGARKQDLPSIWADLNAAGLESGHAYAKSLRTVKSCVGSTWCRFGIGDSVGLAVRLEERYKSIRAPHKIKGGVSGCVRECAEAQSKDFGLIATEKGFNVFVAGNGGAKPRHAELLAKDVLPADVVPMLDRYLMFYIQTADKLQRTAPWLEKLPGGIKYLQRVIIDDELGICASLEAQMKELVGSYFDEWAAAIADPAIAARFTQFDNSAEGMQGVELEEDRGQKRPAHWVKEPARDDFQGLASSWSSTAWEAVLPAAHFAGADDLPNGISATIKRGDTQLALWRIRGRYFATQQMCPHKRAFILSDGLIGETTKATVGDDKSSSSSSSPWVSCPHHKRNFDLGNGSCKNDAELSIATFDVEQRDDGMVYLLLPPLAELDAALGTTKWMVKKGESGEEQLAELDRKLNHVGTRGRKPNAAAKVVKEGAMSMQIAAGGGCGMAPEW